MTRRTIAEIDAELELVTKRKDIWAKIKAGGLTQQEEELELERLSACNAALMEIEEKRAPPPKPKVFPEAAKLTREQALEKADEIRSNPLYFGGPGARDATGRQITKEEHEQLVAIHGELLDRADQVGS